MWVCWGMIGELMGENRAYPLWLYPRIHIQPYAQPEPSNINLPSKIASGLTCLRDLIDSIQCLVDE